MEAKLKRKGYYNGKLCILYANFIILIQPVQLIPGPSHDLNLHPIAIEIIKEESG
jgi:hypothetical protein